MSDKTNSIKVTLNEITKEISNLETEKNLGQIVKQYNKINDDIKKTSLVILDLQNKIRSFDTMKIEDQNMLIMNDDEYELYEKELSNDEINKVINCDDLEMQIEIYQKMLYKLNSCKMYLENKKTVIIECNEFPNDKNNNIVKEYDEKSQYKKKVKKEGKEEKIEKEEKEEKKNNKKRRKKDSISNESINSKSSSSSM